MGSYCFTVTKFRLGVIKKSSENEAGLHDMKMTNDTKRFTKAS